MAKEQALEKKLEQTKWQFPDHIVFERDGRVFHFDPNDFGEGRIYLETGLRVFRGHTPGDVALYDPEYFEGDKSTLRYCGSATERIPQPINLKDYAWLFSGCNGKTLDLSDWDFSEARSMYRTFHGSDFVSITLGNAVFGKCCRWDGCFLGCEGLQDVVVGNYRVPTNNRDGRLFCKDGMFWGCEELQKKYDKTNVQLTDVFLRGQWNTLQPVETMEVF